MKKPAFAAIMALLLFAAANLNLCCRVYVDGRCDGALYSLSSVRRAERSAAAAAEETPKAE